MRWRDDARWAKCIQSILLSGLLFALGGCSAQPAQPSPPPAKEQATEAVEPSPAVTPDADVQGEMNPLLIVEKSGSDYKLYPGMPSADVAAIFHSPADDYTTKYFDAHSLILNFGVGELATISVRDDTWTVNGAALPGASIEEIRSLYGDIYSDSADGSEERPYKLPYETVTYHFDEDGSIVDSQSPHVYSAAFSYLENGIVIGAVIGYADLSYMSAAPPESGGTIFLEESGSGSSAITTGMLISGNGSNPAYITHNGSGDLVISTEGVEIFRRSGAYSGRVLLADIPAGEIQVEADGDWTIKIAYMIGSAEADSVQGTGDDVLLLRLYTNSKLTVTHSGQERLLINTFPFMMGESKYTLLDVSGNYSGELSAAVESDNLYVFEILSEGDWSISADTSP